MKKFNPKFILLFILVAAAVLRFYNYPNRYGFDYDALRDSLLTQYSVTHLAFPLIGPPTSVGNFTFGPWYYYLLDIGGLLLRTIYSPWIVISLLSLVQVYLFYKIGEILENKWLGYILAALVALAPSQITLATGLSNPNVIPFFATAAILIFILIIKKSPPAWLYFLFGLVLGVGVLSHYQMALYLILPIIALLYRPKNWLVHILCLFTGILIALLPLIIFNFLTHGSSFIAMLHYILHGSTTAIYIPNSWHLYLLNFWPSFWIYTLGLPWWLGIGCLLLTIGAFVFMFIKRKMPVVMVLILITFLINFVYFRYYKGERVIYYEYYLQPFLFLFLCYALYFIASMKKTYYLGLILILVIFSVMITASLKQLNYMQSHQFYIALENRLIKQYPNSSFNFYSCKGIQKNQIYAIAFIFASKVKLNSQRIIKIGIVNNKCRTVTMTTQFTYKFYGDTISIIDLSPIGSQQLLRYGWIPVNEKIIYSSVTQWWYLNKNAYADLRINK